jgi:transcription initiation factor TFIID subunit TAF12
MRFLLLLLFKKIHWHAMIEARRLKKQKPKTKPNQTKQQQQQQQQTKVFATKQANAPSASSFPRVKYTGCRGVHFPHISINYEFYEILNSPEKNSVSLMF